MLANPRNHSSAQPPSLGLRCADAWLLVTARVSASLTRIFSDLHVGDPSTLLHSLDDVLPLCDGATQLVLNGDTLETRPGGSAVETAALRAQVLRFFAQSTPPATLLTGNHDPDISLHHHLDLGASVLVSHGDTLFEDLVPWSRDAPRARELVAAELARLTDSQRNQLDPRLAAYRRAAAALPQRRPPAVHGWRHVLRLLQDTVWPPSRAFRILRAWRETPQRAEDFVQRHRPRARFFVMGHTHRLGVHRTSSGIVVLNTGSLCAPSRAGVVDVTPERIALRRIERRGGEFRFGGTVAEFPLAPA